MYSLADQCVVVNRRFLSTTSLRRSKLANTPSNCKLDQRVWCLIAFVCSIQHNRNIEPMNLEVLVISVVEQTMIDWERKHEEVVDEHPVFVIKNLLNILVSLDA